MRTAGSAQNWWLLDSGACEPAFNMALDETLLEFVTELNRPILRFYGWSQPAATFGYFQKIAEIECLTYLRPLLRRPTGGGLVPHNADWTYSVVLPPASDWYQSSATESYERVHRWIQKSFSELGFITELASCCRKEIPGQCFAGYEKSDVLYLGRKMAGAAQRRNKMGLLIQGSVQPQPAGVNRADWQDAMSSQEPFEVLALSENLSVRAQQLVETKYSQDDYNRRR